MNGFDRHQLLSALIYLVLALFVGGGLAAMRHRPMLRVLTLIAYLLALAIALIWVALWLAGAASAARG